MAVRRRQDLWGRWRDVDVKMEGPRREVRTKRVGSSSRYIQTGIGMMTVSTKQVVGIEESFDEGP